MLTRREETKKQRLEFEQAMEHSFVEVDRIVLSEANSDSEHGNDTEQRKDHLEHVTLAQKPSQSVNAEEASTADPYEATLVDRMQHTKQLFDCMSEKLEEAYAFFQQDFELIESKKENLKEMSQKLKAVHFEDVVKLNVGGEIFETSLQTLRKYPDSFFSNMFSEHFQLIKGKDRAYFIDRDGHNFRYVLNFMRTGEVPSRIKSKHADELKAEAKFYCLPSLAKFLSKPSLSILSSLCLSSQSLANESDGGKIIQKHAKQTKDILDDVKQRLDEGHTALKDDFDFLETRRKNFAEMSNRLREAHFPEIIKLNVGGKLFMTSITTLHRDPNCMLAAMFSQRFELVKQDDGAYFIDRDGTYFRHVLNFLRTGKLPRRVTDVCADELREEAEFYNIKALLDYIPDNIVKINVDGDVFHVASETLMKHPTSKLAKMLAGKAKVPRIDGAYFFDRTSNYFKDLLEFMRDGTLMNDELETDDHREELLAEAVYYEVSSLFALICGFEESKILQDKIAYQEQLIDWLQEREHGNAVKLIYSAERDGWNSEVFHSKCDEIGPTLCLMESEFDHIFGGFTVKSWSGCFGRDEQSFLFSLYSKELDAPIIMPSTGAGGIYCHSLNGPSFYNLVLTLSQKPNEGKSTFYGCGSDFKCPRELQQDSSALAGEKEFLLKRLEVFTIKGEEE